MALWFNSAKSEKEYATISNATLDTDAVNISWDEFKAFDSGDSICFYGYANTVSGDVKCKDDFKNWTFKPGLLQFLVPYKDTEKYGKTVKAPIIGLLFKKIFDAGLIGEDCKSGITSINNNAPTLSLLNREWESMNTDKRETLLLSFLIVQPVETIEKMGDKPEIKTGGFKQNYKAKTASEKSKETVLMLNEQFPSFLGNSKTLEDVVSVCVEVKDTFPLLVEFVLASLK